eukprot:CAMPEP_0115098030 /NCGR_PEP_ID=MMETSP0227-20121206/30878_1 /TAXON_ID=89957 /ORGANISM="Polarella glacialis, Strain CCMP 1383" /LENGTH=86 /DNA_ID=CAMNT_0002492481 /DNA_START=112 /DNA_END=369 /DNA_ORIENTATION=-
MPRSASKAASSSSSAAALASAAWLRRPRSFCRWRSRRLTACWARCNGAAVSGTPLVQLLASQQRHWRKGSSPPALRSLSGDGERRM